ncbi:MAG: hypothetical protein K2J61_06295, partial [Clostridia bacterium]|nr:hypothetical protein [Clostridia bacterium]
TGKVLNGFEGGQKEYLYLGKYNNNLIKWRVLAVKDKKYGTGNNLLVFSDSTLGTTAVNTTAKAGASSSGTGGKYSYYGTSKLRAVLNGGYHLNTAGDSMTASKVNDGDAYINKLFEGINSNLIMTANDIVTHDCVNPNTTDTFVYKTVGDIFGGTDVKGKFLTGTVASQPVNTKTGQNDGANNNFDITFSTTTGVTETIKGDKLFPLDYEDMNNRNYGFLNPSNQTYIEALGGSYATNYAAQGYTYGYPARIDTATSVFNNGNGFNSSDGKVYWLRNSVRNTTNTNSVCMYVNNGTIYQISVDTVNNIRPAMVLDANKIAYATATVPTSGGFQSLTTSPATPEYKLYLKNTRFDDYSKDAKGNIKEDGGTLHITYNNPTGISGGNILLLLTKQTATDGAVDYQAVIPMSGNASASRNAVTSISLPSGVSLSTHSVTMMYTSAGSGNAAEEIYCTYPTSSGIDVPLDISGDSIAYDGNSKWIDSLGVNTPEWVDTSIHANPTYMTVTEVVYTDSLGNVTTDTTGSTANIINAGTYKFKMHLASGLTWSTGDSDDKYFSITVKQKKSTPKPKVDPPITTTPYESAGLPTLVSDTGGTSGTFVWDDGEVATAGTKEYNWTFTPTDGNNFTVEKGKMELEFLARELNGISVTDYSPTATVYTNTPLGTIKGYLTVEASYTDGKTEPLTTFKLEVDSTDGKLVAGNNTLVISTNDDLQTITYEITGVMDVSVSAITLVRLKTGSTFKYPVTTDDIKAAISSVSVQWNTGASGNLDLSDLSVLTVSGTLNAGNAVMVTIGVNGTTATKDITIKIDNGDFEVSGITFTGDTVTYDGDNHSIEYSGTLPDGVSVEYEYNGTKQTAPWEFANAGTYNITLSFTHSNANYNAITTTLTATLQIGKAAVTGIVFEGDSKPEITGVTYTLEATGVPSWVTVQYYCNGTLFTGASAAGN